MNLTEIKQAIAEGKRVFWKTPGYEVIKDDLGQYLIKHYRGDCIDLTWRDRATLNGKPEEFFVEEVDEKL
mgnify:CR=1 FL=1